MKYLQLLHNEKNNLRKITQNEINSIVKVIKLFTIEVRDK